MIDGVPGPLGLANHWDILPLGGLPEPGLCLAAGFQIEGNFRRSVRRLAGGPWGTGRIRCSKNSRPTEGSVEGLWPWTVPPMRVVRAMSVSSFFRENGSGD